MTNGARVLVTGCVVLAALAGTAGRASAQLSILVTDRTSNRVMLAVDANGDGVINSADPAELRVYFDGTNAAGLAAPANPNSLGYWNGRALIGDQDSTARRWTWARDLNGDGDALDAGEAGVFADASNASGFSFAFPTGVAFGLDGQIALVNAGNGFGADDIFLASDGNADGNVNGTGEVTRFVTVNGFGTNGSFSPQEIAFDHSGALYLHNSSANLFGVYRLIDADHSGAIDAAGEMTQFFGVGNASGVPSTAGFDLSPDPVRARSFYQWQLASGGVDQLVRLTDLNGDGDAMDAGEAAIVYTTSESGFTSVDSIPLADGTVLISDNSGNKVYRLTDLDGDGTFNGAGERTVFIGSGLTSARAMALVHGVGCSAADLGRQGGLLGGDGLLDNNDFIVFINLFFAQAPLADVGRQGGFAPGDGQFDNNDFIVFINAFFEGCS